MYVFFKSQIDILSRLRWKAVVKNVKEQDKLNS